MMPMMPRSVRVHHEREQRPDAGRRQRGKNRYRMDVALVKHPQYDVDGHDGGEDQQQGARKRGSKGERGALKTGLDADGQAELAFGRFDGVDRVSEGYPVRQVERDGCRGKLPDMVDNERRRLFRIVAIDPRGTCAPVDGGQVEIVQRPRAALILGLDLEYDAVLVRLGKNGGDEPLPEGVV